MSSSRILQLLRLPPAEAARKVRDHAKKKWSARRIRHRDDHAASYANDPLPGPLGRYFHLPDMEILAESAETLRRVTDLYLDHRFDVLGSGWVQVRHGMDCAGLEGHLYGSPGAKPAQEINTANRATSETVTSLLPADYAPIDWHVDFKSGYQWRADTWYQDIPYGHLPGVDIKVPWELARMQHLTALAWAHALAADGQQGLHRPEIYLAEARNQILDFIGHNPPRFGVNWRCSMDVAIRASNWLVAYDLFLSGGADFDEEFEQRFKRALFDHGRHIMGNLEWDPRHRGNHYLANVVGLLFIAAYLPRDAETDSWLAFSHKQLEQETEFQFYDDGGNFEASISYHRLSTEMALYGTALLRVIQPETSLRDGHYERLAAAIGFTAWITKPSGEAPQVGDNDSGRFLKLLPSFDRFHDGETGPSENHLDHRHLLGAGCGFFGDGVLSDTPVQPESSAFRLERNVMQALVCGAPRPLAPRAITRNPAQELSGVPEVPEGKCLGHWKIVVPGGALAEHMSTAAYPEFGLYIYRSDRLYLTVRCGAIGMNGRGGHAHNDQLAVELAIDGEDWIRDPGSYLYTPAPKMRDAYRSVKAHFAPRLQDQEPGSLRRGMFYLGNEAQAQCDVFAETEFLGHHVGFGRRVYRHVEITERAIRILDVLADGTATTMEPMVLEGREAVGDALQPAIPFSPGYGVLLNPRAGA